MATTWRTLGQRQESAITDQGAFEEVMVVSFETVPGQVKGSVTIPMRFYNADYVRDVIEDRVGNINAVGSL
jgi:hypothetical protein